MKPKEEENIQKGKKLAKIAENVDDEVEFKALDENDSKKEGMRIEEKETAIFSSSVNAMEENFETNYKNVPSSSKNPLAAGEREKWIL